MNLLLLGLVVFGSSRQLGTMGVLFDQGGRCWPLSESPLELWPPGDSSCKLHKGEIYDLSTLGL